MPSAELDGDFPSLGLPLAPPLPPIEARAVAALPSGDGWLYEPKWDGFRCLLFRDGDRVALQSKSGQPLTRYFPELVEAAAGLPGSACVLDGEIVVWAGGPRLALDFDALLQRIHPAASRIRRLAEETPASFVAFDLLVDERRKVRAAEPLAKRRERLERLAARLPDGGRFRPSRAAAGPPARRFLLSPATTSRRQGAAWLRAAGAGGIDGIVAKRLDASYEPGDRSAMVKVKPARTADCVVGGFRWAQKSGAARGRAEAVAERADGRKGAGGAEAAGDAARGDAGPEGAGSAVEGRQVGSLLLGLYDDDARLDHVGFCASFTAAERRQLAPILTPHIGPPGFTGRAPGGPSRWNQGRSTEWVPLRPVLVCEVSYDHFSGDRFRHGARFLRWRPEKAPAACTFEQLRPSAAPLASLALEPGGGEGRTAAKP